MANGEIKMEILSMMEQISLEDAITFGTRVLMLKALVLRPLLMIFSSRFPAWLKMLPMLVPAVFSLKWLFSKLHVEMILQSCAGTRN